MSKVVIDHLVNLGGVLGQLQHGTQVITFDDSVLRVTPFPSKDDVRDIALSEEEVFEVVEDYPSANIKNVIKSLIERLVTEGSEVYEHVKIPERKAYFKLMVTLKESVGPMAVGIEIFVGKDAFDYIPPSNGRWRSVLELNV